MYLRQRGVRFHFRFALPALALQIVLAWTFVLSHGDYDTVCRPPLQSAIRRDALTVPAIIINTTMKGLGYRSHTRWPNGLEPRSFYNSSSVISEQELEAQAQIVYAIESRKYGFPAPWAGYTIINFADGVKQLRGCVGISDNNSELIYSIVPTEVDGIAVIGDFLFFFVSLHFLNCFVRIASRSIRRKRKLCLDCGYSMRGIHTEICPECGA